MSANAGFNGLTHHSRANCVNNETVSWDYLHYYNMGVAARHYYNGQLIHELHGGYEVTRRAAVVHWGEGPLGLYGWHVEGFHWMRYPRNDVLVQITKVDDCSIYDGWWDW